MTIKHWKLSAALGALLALAACRPASVVGAGDADAGGSSALPASQPATGAAPAEDRADAVEIREAWQSPMEHADDVDSVAFWQGEHAGQRVSWIVATGKESHDLLVFDAQTGELVRRFGGEGEGAGQFRRPNGIVVHGDWALVVERDNHRVQLLHLPGFDRSAFVGQDLLRRPYGATVAPSGARQIELYVTDNYLANGAIPPAKELGERVKHFRVALAGDRPVAELVASFGETEEPGALKKVETIFADPANDRLLIAEEHGASSVFKVYDLAGRFSGEVVGQGLFFHETEGLALRECGENGYWIATDQAPDLSLFRVFGRADFAYKGTFVGALTANTDGVTHTAAPTEAFPDGAFFAVHDDQGVTAFDWRAIREALGLDADC